MQPTELRLSEVVTGIEKMLRRIIGESIELTTDIGPTVGVVRADPGQLDQVILNLSINARDADGRRRAAAHLDPEREL